MSEALIKQIEEKMLTSINYLVDDFATIRTGRANPALVDNLNIEYYGTKTPLQQLATISVPDPKLLVIQPFDKTALEEIEKSISVVKAPRCGESTVPLENSTWDAGSGQDEV